MKVVVGDHALRRARERGTDVDEIREVLQSGSDIEAKHGEMGKAKVFEFQRERNTAYTMSRSVWRSSTR